MPRNLSFFRVRGSKITTRFGIKILYTKFDPFPHNVAAFFETQTLPLVKDTRYLSYFPRLCHVQSSLTTETSNSVFFFTLPRFPNIPDRYPRKNQAMPPDHLMLIPHLAFCFKCTKGYGQCTYRFTHAKATSEITFRQLRSLRRR